MGASGHQQSWGQQIRKLFDDCLELNEQQQIAYIAQADVPKAVKQHVYQLLKITGSEIELTQKVIDSVQVSLDVKPIVAQMKIGAYELKKPIGEGGQAEVWLAERFDGEFSHQVAIKFLKPLHDQKDLIRFQSERALLATLKHPNIAQLLDGGELGENRPYMVLEYVEGLPLLEYGLLKKFTLKQYLDCFRQICDAVSYAHSHSIIHRDIKPSNIYITIDGVVKLLDFGIAKFMNHENLGVQTLPMMTLAYSSPEQVTGQTISTATDVYGLGLLLYEMLTGVRAQAVNNSIPAEVINEITDITAMPPSEVIRKLDFDRNYSSRDIQGDLDNLILMAIRKEPERRYGNVEALAQDVKNYQEGKSLLAAGDSWAYHAKKFINRNPVVTLTSLALLAFMIVVPIIQYDNQKQIELERDKALVASKKAEEQGLIAERTTEFLIHVIESASPMANQGEEISLTDVLDSAEKQLTHGLDQQPEIKANLMLKLGSIHSHLGNYVHALEYYSRAQLIFQDIEDLSGQITSLDKLAETSYLNKDVEGAQIFMQKAEQLSPQLTNPVDTAWHQIERVKIMHIMGQTEATMPRLTDTLKLLKRNKINDHKLLGELYQSLAIGSKSHVLALAYLEKSMYHAQHQGGGKVVPVYYERLLMKAALLTKEDLPERAVTTYLEAQAMAEQLYSKSHPKYAELVAKMAEVFHGFGRLPEAKLYFEQAIQIYHSIERSQDIGYAITISNYAALLEELKLYQASEQYYKEALALDATTDVSQRFYRDALLTDLARLLRKMGKYNESNTLRHPSFSTNVVLD